MLLKILAWFWIVLGILSLIWPQLLKKRLTKKSYKRVRKILFLAAIFLSLSLISISFKLTGLLPKIIAIIGIVAIFKVVFVLKGRASDRLVEWFQNKPLILFRLAGAIYLVIGLIILKFSN